MTGHSLLTLTWPSGPGFKHLNKYILEIPQITEAGLVHPLDCLLWQIQWVLWYRPKWVQGKLQFKVVIRDCLQIVKANLELNPLNVRS